MIGKSILKFIHNELNSNSVNQNLLRVKFTSKNVCFADNYSFYHTNILVTLTILFRQMILSILLNKLEIKFHSKQNISDVDTSEKIMQHERQCWF